MKAKTTIVIIIILGSFILFFAKCSDADKHYQNDDEKMAVTHCSSCHLFPTPDLLDSITWADKVLPAMAPKLGIGVWHRTEYYDKNLNGQHDGLAFEDWKKIVKYYATEAPKTLASPKPDIQPIESWNIFGLKRASLAKNEKKATTSLVHIDPKNSVIYSASAEHNMLYRWDKQLNYQEVSRTPSPAVNLFLQDDSSVVITGIGALTGRNLNTANGTLTIHTPDSGKKYSVLADRLHRPVQAAPIDIDRDGLRDWVVAEFGHDLGGLTLLHQVSEGRYERKQISDMPGAEQIVVDDFNGDGWPDLMVLFAQAREGIWLFTNDKKGGFKSRMLLEFPPVYGSTSFQLVDFDGDGQLDLLYTCGDNADYSPILKPYHGVYIFMNKGGFKYEQAWFYPMNGCTKAIAADFDNDGDVDIAAIAFFADFDRHPAASFLYFEQTDELRFTPYSPPINKYGRWITMDAGDYDGDGDIDIVLGNFSGLFGNNFDAKDNYSGSLPFIVLRNKTY